MVAAVDTRKRPAFCSNKNYMLCMCALHVCVSVFNVVARRYCK